MISIRCASPIYAFIALLAFVGLPGDLLAEEEVCDHQPIAEFFVPGITGQGTLCQSPEGVRGQLRARGLTPGDAYTIWWIYIDRPDLCVPDFTAPPGFECDFSFFQNDGDPLAVIGRMDSGIAPENGRMVFRDTIAGMQMSSGAIMMLFINAHGSASEDGRALARQLLTPEDPFFGTPHHGIDGGNLALPAALSFHVVP